ncbi:hypothetical protein TYRP_011519 [Tyrophagus putrescentiae]|nr:hypothetical protein TYRP_011519 [Tyrophagus putrescentiae]
MSGEPQECTVQQLVSHCEFYAVFIVLGHLVHLPCTVSIVYHSRPLKPGPAARLAAIGEGHQHLRLLLFRVDGQVVGASGPHQWPPSCLKQKRRCLRLAFQRGNSFAMEKGFIPELSTITQP